MIARLDGCFSVHLVELNGFHVVSSRHFFAVELFYPLEFSKELKESGLYMYAYVCIYI